MVEWKGINSVKQSNEILVARCLRYVVDESELLDGLENAIVNAIARRLNEREVFIRDMPSSERDDDCYEDIDRGLSSADDPDIVRGKEALDRIFMRLDDMFEREGVFKERSDRAEAALRERCEALERVLERAKEELERDKEPIADMVGAFCAYTIICDALASSQPPQERTAVIVDAGVRPPLVIEDESEKPQERKQIITQDEMDGMLADHREGEKPQRETVRRIATEAWTLENVIKLAEDGPVDILYGGRTYVLEEQEGDE